MYIKLLKKIIQKKTKQNMIISWANHRPSFGHLTKNQNNKNNWVHDDYIGSTKMLANFQAYKNTTHLEHSIYKDILKAEQQKAIHLTVWGEEKVENGHGTKSWLLDAKNLDLINIK